MSLRRDVAAATLLLLVPALTASQSKTQSPFFDNKAELMKVPIGVIPHGLPLPAAGAQTDIQSFKSRAELVQIPAVVTHAGQPVRGLKGSDFVVTHDGKNEVVAVCEEIDAAPVRMERITLPPRTAQNFAGGDNHQDVAILFLDFLNGSWSTSARIQSYLKEITQEFADTHTPVTVLLMTGDGLVEVHSFASDSEDLGALIKKWSTHAPRTYQQLGGMVPEWAGPLSQVRSTQGLAILDHYAAFIGLRASFLKLDTARMTLHAFEQVAEAFRGVPGRKKLIWMSTGFPLSEFVEHPSSAAARLEVELAELVIKVWKALNDANVAVYTVDSNGVVNPSWDSKFSPEPPGSGLRSLEAPTNTPSMLEISQRTGGASCTMKPPDCVQKALADAEHYYMLGFYLHGDNKPGWHELKVRVERPGVSIRAREGFVVGAGTSPNPPVAQNVATIKQSDSANPASSSPDDSPEKTEVLTAIASPLDYTAVPLRVRWSAVPQQGKLQVEVVLNSPPGGIALNASDGSMNLDILAFVRPLGKSDGQSFPKTIAGRPTPAGLERLRTVGFEFTRQIVLDPGRYELKMMLRDNVARRIGTVSTAVELK